MKKEIHPKYGSAKIQCACGNSFETKSTSQGTVQVDICSVCHPFFTGKQKIMDTSGRLDRIKKKFGSKVALGNSKSQKPVPAPQGALSPKQPIASKLTLKDRLQAAKEKAASKVQ
jgi:large subunit ribosomal protein L31